MAFLLIVVLVLVIVDAILCLLLVLVGRGSPIFFLIAEAPIQVVLFSPT